MINGKYVELNQEELDQIELQKQLQEEQELLKQLQPTEEEIENANFDLKILILLMEVDVI